MTKSISRLEEKVRKPFRTKINAADLIQAGNGAEQRFCVRGIRKGEQSNAPCLTQKGGRRMGRKGVYLFNLSH